MKALRVNQFSDDASGIELCNIEDPTPVKGQVAVKMLYSPINPSDFNFIRGDYYNALSRLLWNQQQQVPAFNSDPLSKHPQLPYILGGEGVGIVTASGGGFLANRLIGKRVAIAVGPPMGTWQQTTVIDAKKAVPLPDAISDQQGAMLLINPLSVLGMISDVLQVKPGTWLLQSGAASALGQMVIKLSKKLGFKTINIVRNEDKIEQLKQLGADVVICTKSQDVLSEVNKATQGQGVHYGMDCIGGELLSTMMQCMSVNGHMLLYGTLAAPSSNLFSRDLMMPCAIVSGFFAGNWLAQKSLWQKIKLIKQLKKYAVEGVFETEVSSEYCLEDFHQALAAASKPGKTGKVLFKFAD